MSFTATSIPVSRYSFFAYYANGTASLAETFDPSCAFELQEIRLHLSTGLASVEDFNAYLVAGQTTTAGSVSIYDAILFSYAMQGSTDYIWQPSRTMYFNRGDTLSLSMYISAANKFGLTVQGWKITA